MSLHSEIKFDTELCEHLAANGWMYADKGAAGFVRGLCLFPEDVLAWVQTTQPDAWNDRTRNHRVAAAFHRATAATPCSVNLKQELEHQ